MYSFPFSFLSGSCDIPVVYLSKGRKTVSLSKGMPTVSRLDNRPTLCLRVSNVIKKELGGKKICTFKRLTPKQYKNLKNQGSLRKIVKRLTSEQLQSLKKSRDIKKCPNRGCPDCGNMECDC